MVFGFGKKRGMSSPQKAAVLTHALGPLEEELKEAKKKGLPIPGPISIEAVVAQALSAMRQPDDDATVRLMLGHIASYSGIIVLDVDGLNEWAKTANLATLHSISKCTTSTLK